MQKSKMTTELLLIPSTNNQFYLKINKTEQ